MYGKWLYKEIGTEYGACKVEIYRKNYTGVSIEIGALAADSLSIALENLGSITDPIGKSVCSFSIIDTNQVEYDDFFTPDATALKVVVSTRVGSGAYATRWSGYITPDFFAENLSYRTPISISARDNIGYLNDVDFDLTATTITVRELIQSAFRKIAEDYPMSLSFVTQKQTAEGILAIDATISTTLLKEMSWGEALETILHDLGLQMRWVDNNTIAVLDLSQIPEYYATQGFNFVDASGYREIVPAWRELSQKQEYGLIENFFRGRISEEDLTFVKEEQVVIDGYNTSTMRYYSPKNWLGNGLTINYNDYFFSIGGTMSESERNRIYFTGISKDTTAYIDKYMGWRQPVYKSNNAMKISFKALNSIQVVSQYSLPGLPILQTFGPYSPGTAQFGLKVNVLLHSGTKTYIMRYKWEELNTDETDAINFVLPILQGNANEEECTIDLGNIPYDGELELRIYGWYFIEATNWTAMPLNAVSYITDVVYSYDTNGAISGRDAKVQVSELHNVKNDTDYSFGEVPLDCGGINAYAGGLYKSDGDELIGFQRNADATNYNLLELVGRELIHFNKKNYNRLSGTIRNLDKEPLMFNRLFVREGKKYAPYNYSLNVISNEMNITSMQEVEPYETATFNTIDSQITTGGGTVSGGNNTILQYSEEAGNEKRLYELQTATEQEKNDAYVLLDKAGFPEARKVHISELGGFDVSELEQYLERNGYATLKRIWEVDTANAVVRTTYNVVSTQEVISGRRASGASSDVTGGGGISQVTAQMIVDALGYVPYSSQNPSGYITSSALNGYATETWVEAKKYLTAIPSEYITETKLSNTLGGYQTKITSSNKLAYSLISGTPTLATVATSGKYSDLSGTPSSLPASDVYAWAKAATKPSYTASEVGALSTGGGTLTGGLTISSGNLLVSKTAGDVIVNQLYPTADNAYLLGHSGRRWSDLYTVLINGGTPINSNNYSSYALPLSGGTLTNSLAVSAGTISSTRTSTRRAVFYKNASTSMDAGTYIVDVSDSGDAVLKLTYDSLTWKGNTVIHSGNIGYQSVNYANSAFSASRFPCKLNEGFDANSNEYLLLSDYGSENPKYNIPADFGFGTIFTPLPSNGMSSLLGQFAWGINHNTSTPTRKLWFRASNNLGWGNDWKTIAFTDSNVASATKLQTARTIWGQSFDGSGNVSGALYDTSGQEFIYSSGNLVRLGTGTAAKGCNTYIDGNNIYLRYGTAYKDGIALTSSGNVLIGTTTDNGAKLQVNGGITSDSIKLGSYTLEKSTYGMTLSGQYVGFTLKGTNAYNTGVSFADADGVERWVLSYRGVNGGANKDLYIYRTTDNGVTDTVMRLYRASGNVVIGGTADNGAKLQVTGNLTATGEVISTRRATSSDARLKDNINRLLAEDCLAMVRNLQPSSWDWIENGEHSMGFIAQDVEQYMPYAVTRIEDDILGQRLNLQYDQFFAPVVGAIQCLDVKVNSHEDEIEGLKNEVAELKQKLSKYETVWQ